MEFNVWQHAISAIKAGLTANEAYEARKTAGFAMRRADYLAVHREAKAELARNAKAYDRSGDRKPYTSEIFVATGAVATGFIQHVDIWVKDLETGEIYSRPYSIRTDDLLTHNDVIETALDRYEDHAENYGHSILGASYSSTYMFVPRSQ